MFDVFGFETPARISARAVDEDRRLLQLTERQIADSQQMSTIKVEILVIEAK
jgi:hypothetical protein